MTVNREYYANGQPKYEYSYQNDKLHGVCKGWYENGKPKYEHSYQNDKPHGVCKGWHENGKPKYKKYYLYGEEVHQEEYKRHQLIIGLLEI